jgi:hypothetical protein
MTNLQQYTQNSYKPYKSKSLFKRRDKSKAAFSENITDVINKYERRFQWSDDASQDSSFTRIVVR